MIREKVEDYVRTIPDFPQPGIMFRDITSILQDPDGLAMAIDEMQEKLKGVEYDSIAGLESRGFIFGMPIAYNLHKPFIPIRKKYFFCLLCNSKIIIATIWNRYVLYFPKDTVFISH